MELKCSRRVFLQGCAAAVAEGGFRGTVAETAEGRPLEQIDYGQVTLRSDVHLAQRENTHDVLMGLNNDSLLKPFRAMVDQPAPGENIGGWYQYKADYDYKSDAVGLAPSATFGQWISALSRVYATTGDAATREKVLQLNQLYAETISPVYYEKNRFPAYCYDKLVCGLMDAHRLAGDGDAFRTLNRTTDAAERRLPGHAVDRETPWRGTRDISWNWDESYTMPENLYLVYRMGAGRRYRKMAERYLDNATFFDRLAAGENVLGHKHAYSYVNSLCSAMQAYMVGGSKKHLDAARNGFDMLEQQSYATGGWGPEELLCKPGSDELFESLTKSHHSFETPCGSYAHMKLTRYLLRVTRDGRYGDSMERVMYNSVLGAKPLQADGRAFYNSDYSFEGRRVYSDNRWPCCSGTLPQVAADYGINSYFRDKGSVWVNLYIASVLRWNEGSAQMELEQSGDYPLSDGVTLRVKASSPAAFALHLRIPAWADGARISVNGLAVPVQVVTGFASVSRTWSTGDVVELELPAKPRLQAINASHPETAAVMCGPLVLFALAGTQTGSLAGTQTGSLAGTLNGSLTGTLNGTLTGTQTSSPQPTVTREQALAVRRTGRGEWAVETGTDPLRLVPFTEVGDSSYTTYLQLS